MIEGQIVIEVPAPRQECPGLLGRDCAVYLVESGTEVPLRNVMFATLRMEPGHLVTALVTLGRDTPDPRTGLWSEHKRYEVAEVRIRGSKTRGKRRASLGHLGLHLPDRLRSALAPSRPLKVA